jgi:GR25 family glycosyltransferase involved in LPS biosynthesis
MTDPDKAMQPAAWHFFDKIYCISLESRRDRLMEARRQFASVGLAGRVEFVIVQKNIDDQVKGIFQSHMSCLTKGLAAGARHILVFEDDILFRDFTEQNLHEACRFLQETGRWDAFFLGCLTNGSTRTVSAAVAKVKYRCLAHAYALSRPFAERLVREEWSGIPFDELLRRNNDKFFALYPMCAYQGLAGSDNRTVALDWLRNLFGGLPFIQRGNEVFQNNKPLIFSLHLLFAALALAFLTLYIRQ